MSHTPIRFGQISFLNTLPLALGNNSCAELELQVTQAPPKQLNEMILDGRLDVSAVSSAFYLKHQQQLTLLKQPCVGSMGPVQSVCLFLPADCKSNKTTWHVPSTSETSIAMARWLLTQQHINPSQPNIYPIGQGQALIEQGEIVLAIGDEALLLNHQFKNSATVQVLDIASEWVEQTGQPAVFGVWVAQQHWAQQNPQTLALLENKLAEQAQAFFTNPNTQRHVLELAQQRYPQLWQVLGQQGIKQYLTQSLFYNFSDAAKLSLNTLEQLCLQPQNNSPQNELISL